MLRQRKQSEKSKKGSSIISADSAGIKPIQSFPYIYIALTIPFIIVRIIGAIYTPILDCDETFNYWEPTHFFLYGHGFQTWEYSPEFGLRSYFYLFPYILICFILKLFQVDVVFGKIVLWYSIRIFLGLITLFCEMSFLKSIRNRFGPNCATFSYIFLLISPGMFHSSVSFLPQTFVMWFIMLAMSAWMNEQPALLIFYIGVASLIGWPFSVLIGLPAGIYIVYKFRNNILYPIKIGIISVIFCILPSVLVDYYFYRKFIIAIYNIAVYNSSVTSGGATIFGVEPVSYYIYNILLNFNIVGCLLLITPILSIILLILPRYYYIRSMALDILKFTSPCYLWLILMFPMPHKEERFLFPVYPIMCLSAAISSSFFLDLDIFRLLFHSKKNYLRKIFSFLGLILLITSFFSFSFARSAAIVKYYTSPYNVYSHLSYNIIEQKANVCVGKEWYRFPSSFFLPGQIRLKFIHSNFTGLLPKYYSEDEHLYYSTSIIPSDMNNKNEREESRYIPLSDCDYIVDLDLPHQTEPHYDTFEEFEVIYESEFLDAEYSSRIHRAFFFPPFYQNIVFRSYQLLRRKT